MVRVNHSLVLSVLIGSMLTAATYFHGVRATGVVGPGGTVPIDHGFPLPWVRQSFAIPTLPAIASVFSVFWYGLGVDLAFWAVIVYIGYRILVAGRLMSKH
jgi:hypothetical protein